MSSSSSGGLCQFSNGRGILSQRKTSVRFEQKRKRKVKFKRKMFLSEDCINFITDINGGKMDEYDVISDDDLALIPRKASFSDCSSNGIVSQDSGHDSYLEEGTGYSGDDEETLQCDICNVSKQENGNKRKRNGYYQKIGRKRKWQKKMKRLAKIEREEKPPIKLRELPKTDMFEFEGEKKVEFKWTLQCYIDTMLVPRLRSVIIDRGRPEDLGEDNLMVFDESSKYCEIQKWRRDVFTSLNKRNEREISKFNLLPTYLSCESCTERRQKDVKLAICEGKDLRLSPGASPIYRPDENNIVMKNKEVWRKQILNDLKLNNSKAISNMKSLRRQSQKAQHRLQKTSFSKKLDNLSVVEEEESWEIYDINSEGEVLKTSDNVSIAKEEEESREIYDTNLEREVLKTSDNLSIDTDEDSWEIYDINSDREVLKTSDNLSIATEEEDCWEIYDINSEGEVCCFDI